MSTSSHVHSHKSCMCILRRVAKYQNAAVRFQPSCGLRDIRRCGETTPVELTKDFSSLLTVQMAARPRCTGPHPQCLPRTDQQSLLHPETSLTGPSCVLALRPALCRLAQLDRPRSDQSRRSDTSDELRLRCSRPASRRHPRSLAYCRPRHTRMAREDLRT